MISFVCALMTYMNTHELDALHAFHDLRYIQYEINLFIFKYTNYLDHTPYIVGSCTGIHFHGGSSICVRKLSYIHVGVINSNSIRTCTCTCI